MKSGLPETNCETPMPSVRKPASSYAGDLPEMVVRSLIDSPRFYSVDTRLYFFHCVWYDSDLMLWSFSKHKAQSYAKSRNAQIRCLRAIAGLALNTHYTINTLLRRSAE